MWPSGTMLIVKKKGTLFTFIRHFGVYFKRFLGRKNVVVEATKESGISITPIEKFLDGRTESLEVKERPTTANLSDIKDRARSLLGSAYALLTGNCEQTANFIQLGNYESKQVKFALAAGFGIAFFYLVKNS